MNKFMSQILQVAAKDLSSEKPEKPSDAIATVHDKREFVNQQVVPDDSALHADKRQELDQKLKIGVPNWQLMTAICVLWFSTLFWSTALKMTSGRLILNLEVERSKIKLTADLDKREMQSSEQDEAQTVDGLADK